MSVPTPFISLRPEGILLGVKAKPGLSRPTPLRLVPLADNGQALEVSVAVPPEDGKANKAILERLAKEFGLKKNQLSIKSGESGRIKIIAIKGDPEKLSLLIRSHFS